MRTYIARIEIPQEWYSYSTGKLGEKLFEKWFINNYQKEQIFKQSADRDYQGVDFADEKGITYQVKATAANSYTFHANLDNLYDHLTCDYYVCIQIRNEIAYIENIYTKEQILNLAKQSFKEKNQSFVYSKDLLQQKLF
jgi:hypothetical protein